MNWFFVSSFSFLPDELFVFPNASFLVLVAKTHVKIRLRKA